MLKPKEREILSEQIKQAAVGWAIGESSVEEINQFGIGQATQMAFLKAIKNLSVEPDFVIIDAFQIKGFDLKRQQPIAGGDRLSVAIAAASIVAKVYRDQLMEELDLQFPQYQFAKHKGYGTKVHQEAIAKHGLCNLHRTSFNLEKFL